MENAGAWADLAEDADEEGDKPKQNGEGAAGDDEDDEGGEQEGGDDLWEQFQSREEQQLQQVRTNWSQKAQRCCCLWRPQHDVGKFRKVCVPHIERTSRQQRRTVSPAECHCMSQSGHVAQRFAAATLHFHVRKEDGRGEIAGKAGHQ